MSTTEKFTGKAEIYAKARPSYPQAFLDYLIETNQLTEKSVIADIGAGTGILTKQLWERGLSVIAVEPNEDMRLVLEKELGSCEKLTIVNATAEQTTLAEHSLDLITVAQAFHWFDVAKFKAECKRILKPNKKVSLVWNSRVLDSEFVQKNIEICRRSCASFVGFSRGIEESSERYTDFFKNGIYEYQQFDNPIIMTLEGFIGRNLSSSYSLKQGEDGFTQYVEDLTELFQQYAKDGLLNYPNITQSYLGEV